MDLTTPISGAVRSRTGPNREESTPRAVPARQASKKPKVMRQKGEEDGAPKIPVGDQLHQAEHNRNRRYQKDLLSQCHGAQLPDDEPHGHRPQPHAPAASSVFAPYPR